MQQIGLDLQPERAFGGAAEGADFGEVRAEAVEGRELYRLPREAWEPVYTWHTEKDPCLDYIFETFNRNHRELGLSCEATPEDFHGHSMSVSDIIEYPDGRLWFCDSLGWKEIIWQSN